MASAIYWSYIALQSTSTSDVNLTVSKKGFIFLTALSTAVKISFPRSISPTRVRPRNNNVELRKTGGQVQRGHHKFGKYSSQH